MYSTNGRVKDKNKETASHKKETKKLICEACGYIEIGRYKEFGEEAVCSKCNSTLVRFE